MYELIQLSEDPSKPLSDSTIVEILEKEGIVLARRVWRGWPSRLFERTL